MDKRENACRYPLVSETFASARLGACIPCRHKDAAAFTCAFGLYVSPPAHAAVLCVDEKSHIQALDRSQPMLPMRPGQPARRSHDYKRHGIISLFAALDIATVAAKYAHTSGRESNAHQNSHDGDRAPLSVAT